MGEFDFLIHAETILLVIDMQNDFCAPGGKIDQRGTDISAARKIIPNVKRMIDECREIGVRVIFVRGENGLLTGSPTWNNRPAAKRDSSLGMRLIEPGSWGVQIVDELKPLPGDTVVVKFRYDAFKDTGLLTILRSNGIKNVVFVGVATNACVESSVRAAFMEDYNVMVASDCVAAYQQELHEASLKTISIYFGRVSESQEIVEDLRASLIHA
ncbi:MAG: cysteine hydrolase family protein [Ktedonobacteraceae bacterium]